MNWRVALCAWCAAFHAVKAGTHPTDPIWSDAGLSVVIGVASALVAAWSWEREGEGGTR